MDDEELAFWGEFGRRLTPDTVRLMDWQNADVMKLWNAFGALEAKVRANEPQP